MAVDVSKINLYDLLGIQLGATQKEIVSAYRKKALKYHPDKNPGDEVAAETFLKLSKALEILSDGPARAAYDNVLKAKEASKQRSLLLDSKRKKFKDDLEAREKAAENATQATSKVTRSLEEEIKRLRKEGSLLLEQEQERLREQIRQQQQSAAKSADVHGDHDGGQDEAPRLYVKWKATGPDASSPNPMSCASDAYNEETLRHLFGKYGEVSAVLLSKKRKTAGSGGSAMLEFSSGSSRLAAAEEEVGLPGNPLIARWYNSVPSQMSSSGASSSSDALGHNAAGTYSASPGQSRPGEPEAQLRSGSDLNDYENLVLRRLRQAEERRQLIEQMKAEDAVADGEGCR